MSNSFACLDDSLLIRTAECSGINLGDSREDIRDNIYTIKQIELDRLDKFNSENPVVYLPPIIDISCEEFNSSDLSPRTNAESEEGTHINVLPQSDSPWIEVNRKSNSCRGRRKLILLLNDRYFLEY